MGRQQVLQGSRHEEILLPETKFLALRRAVVGVQDAREVLGIDLFRHRLRVAPGVEHLHMERRHGTARPKPQMVHRRTAVTGNELVEGHGIDVLGIHPLVPHTPIGVDAGTATATEVDAITGIRPRGLPRVTHTQPTAGTLLLRTLVIDDLLENTVVETDAVPHGRVVQRRQRIEIASRKPPETAVTQTRIGLEPNNLLVAEPQPGEHGAGFLFEVLPEAGDSIRQRAARQIFHRQVANALSAGFGDSCLRRHPTRTELLVNCKREGVVDIARGCARGRLAQGTNQTRQQRGPDLARLKHRQKTGDTGIHLGRHCRSAPVVPRCHAKV